jgi:hypothetical protein
MRMSGDRCKICWVFLTYACYSKHKSPTGRVPRDGKICPKCFTFLSEEEKKEYTRYSYQSYDVDMKSRKK